MPGSLQKAGICARYVLRNLRALSRGRLGLHAGESGTTHEDFSVEQSVAYLKRVFDDYLTYGGVSRDWLEGKRILEIGPGDNLGVALLLAAAGARQVVCLDRFETRSDPARSRKIYEALRAGLALQEAERFDEALDLSGPRGTVTPARADRASGPRGTVTPTRADRAAGRETGRGDSPQASQASEKVRTVIGVPIERADTVLEAASFDWIISRAVLEEVSNSKLTACLAAQDRLLAPGGRLTHKIDLRDYHIFSGHGFHPLEYWTLPPWLHTLMSSHEPAPNRQRTSAYRATLENLGYRCNLFVTHLAGTDEEIEPHWSLGGQSPRLELIAPPVVKLAGVTVPTHGDPRVERARELVAEIRSRLAPPFRALSDEDLMTTGVFVTAERR